MEVSQYRTWWTECQIIFNCLFELDREETAQCWLDFNKFLLQRIAALQTRKVFSDLQRSSQTAPFESEVKRVTRILSYYAYVAGGWWIMFIGGF